MDGYRITQQTKMLIDQLDEEFLKKTSPQTHKHTPSQWKAKKKPRNKREKKSTKSK